MSASVFSNAFIASGIYVTKFGDIDYGYVSNLLDYRPVINIDTSKITFTGVGTKENPYNIEIK